MHVKDIIQKKKNLENIKIKVDNDKSILLINIMKLTRKLSFYVDNALLNIKLINALKNKYNIKNSFIEDVSLIKKNMFFNKLKNKIVKEKVLYIYLTEEQKYKTDSYTRYERTILKNIQNKKADFILIGSRAKQFAQQNNLNVIKDFDNSEVDNLVKTLAQMVKFLFLESEYRLVNFVINSNKNFKEAFSLLPLVKFDVDKLLHIQPINEFDKVIQDYKIYPSIEGFIENEINIFLENSINALIIESSFYNTKNNLVTTNKKSKQLDEEILKVSKKIRRVKQEKEIEEITLLTRKKRTVFQEDRS